MDRPLLPASALTAMLDDNARLERLRTAAETVRNRGTLGNQPPLRFLVERSLTGRTPKEIEVAQEVFDLSTSE